jgi:hypothetical protein
MLRQSLGSQGIRSFTRNALCFVVLVLIRVSVGPKSGVNFVVFVQICPKIDICSQNLCSSWSNFTKVTSAFQRFQPANSTQYLLGLLRNEGRVD